MFDTFPPNNFYNMLGCRMRWFRGRKSPDIWDEDVPDSINDLEAAQRIRRICAAAADFAKNVNSGTGEPAEKARYERAAKTAMQIALKISDDLVRDSALREIIDLCVKANNLRRAEVLLRGIQAVAIREAVLNDNPVLRR
jgi:hypothetical protein